MQQSLLQKVETDRHSRPGACVCVRLSLTKIIPAVICDSDVSGSSWYHGDFVVAERAAWQTETVKCLVFNIIHTIKGKCLFFSQSGTHMLH